MEVEFEGSDVQDYVSVPPGTYVCEVAEVRVGATRNGEERWALRLVVREGEFQGRQAAWDSLVFTDRARPRVRRVFAALGLPTEGKVQVEPDDLKGKVALVEVRPSEYRDGSGLVVRRNEVPYAGYRPLAGPGGDDPPF